MVATVVLYIVGGSYCFYDSSASSSYFYFACLREGLRILFARSKFVKAKDLIQWKSRILSAADMWLLGYNMRYKPRVLFTNVAPEAHSAGLLTTQAPFKLIVNVGQKLVYNTNAFI